MYYCRTVQNEWVGEYNQKLIIHKSPTMIMNQILNNWQKKKTLKLLSLRGHIIPVCLLVKLVLFTKFTRSVYFIFENYYFVSAL